MKLKTLIPTLLCAVGMAQALSPVETYGALSIKNGQLVDSKGTAVILRGMSLFWHYDNGGKEFWNASVVGYVQTDWHNSVIRAPIGVEDHAITGGLTAKGYITSPTDAMNKIHSVVDAAILYGSYVIIDWHTHNAQTTAAKTFFETLAKEYGNTPNIIWEIFNEPTDGQAVSHAQTIVPLIRKYSDNVILVGSSSWSANPQEWGGQLDSYKNIAYTIHFYSDHSFWGRIGETNAKGHAVFASEWGMSSSSGNGGFQSITSDGNIKNWINNLESTKTSYTNWSLGNATVNGAGQTPETSAALQLSATKTPKIGGTVWANSDLTPSGQSIKAWLVSKNPAWTWADTTTKQISDLAVTSTGTSPYKYGKDSVFIAAGFNKATAWTVTETGRTSSAVFSSSGVGANVSVRHIIGARSTSTLWKNETVDVKLMPFGKTASYVITEVPVGVVRRPLYEKNIAWEGSDLYIGHDLIPKGTPVTVNIRNAKGQIVWSRKSEVGPLANLSLGERPRLPGLLVLDVVSDIAIVRSRLAPLF